MFTCYHDDPRANSIAPSPQLLCDEVVNRDSRGLPNKERGRGRSRRINGKLGAGNEVKCERLFPSPAPRRAEFKMFGAQSLIFVALQGTCGLHFYAIASREMLLLGERNSFLEFFSVSPPPLRLQLARFSTA
jgi:hypothetical protein